MFGAKKHMKKAITFLYMTCFVIAVTGCDKASQTSFDTSDYDKQVKEFWEQSIEAERQLEVSAEQQRISEAQLKTSEDQAMRFDRLLDKWEEQATRQDKILNAMEKKYGVTKP